MYHFNPKTGETGLCQAKRGKCPFGTLDAHFTSEEAARAAYESSMANQVLVTTSKASIAAVADPGRPQGSIDESLYGSIVKNTPDPEVYVHPQGKVFIYDRSTGVSRVYKNGIPAKTGGSIEDMRSGRGAWKPVDVSQFKGGAPASNRALQAQLDKKKALADLGLPLNSPLDPTLANTFKEGQLQSGDRWDPAPILPIENRLNPHKPGIEKHAVQSYWGTHDAQRNLVEGPHFEVWKSESGKYRLVTTSYTDTIPALGSTEYFMHDQTRGRLWGGEKATLVGAFKAEPGGAMIGDVPNRSMPVATYK